MRWLLSVALLKEYQDDEHMCDKYLLRHLRQRKCFERNIVEEISGFATGDLKIGRTQKAVSRSNGELSCPSVKYSKSV